MYCDLSNAEGRLGILDLPSHSSSSSNELSIAVIIIMYLSRVSCVLPLGNRTLYQSTFSTWFTTLWFGVTGRKQNILNISLTTAALEMRFCKSYLILMLFEYILKTFSLFHKFLPQITPTINWTQQQQRWVGNGQWVFDKFRFLIRTLLFYHNQ